MYWWQLLAWCAEWHAQPDALVHRILEASWCERLGEYVYRLEMR